MVQQFFAYLSNPRVLIMVLLLLMVGAVIALEDPLSIIAMGG